MVQSRRLSATSYSLLGLDWNRPHLYQAVAFATGYHVTRAGVFGFTPAGASPPPLKVGPVGLRAFAWHADETAAPETSAVMLLDQARDWINAAE